MLCPRSLKSEQKSHFISETITKLHLETNTLKNTKNNLYEFTDHPSHYFRNRRN